ncbi:YkgJ family cysteine cluster protein [Nitrosopumilus sp.]|uniref:YkgJ family cysteine cluster protein n=1 Tax=Nitrosopumilus sp. TaxID=2024843 RepID=UPI002930080F|nr:YkgJ family cysteine cluster protein [Nitrosopumilus sp.]
MHTYDDDDIHYDKQRTSSSSFLASLQLITKKQQNPSEKKFSMPGLCNSCTHKQCCTGFASPLVFEKDFENLKSIQKSQYVQIKTINGKSVRTIVKKKQSTKGNNNNSNACVFWNEEDSCCSIYEHRPFDCKIFPFDIYKIDGKYVWIVYSCNNNNSNTNEDRNSWKWTEGILEELEQDPQFEDILKNIDVYSDITEIDSLEESKRMQFVILREIDSSAHRKQR